ncbi:MAG: response regulator transcription factor [Actinomycetota bacterium]
MAGARTVLVASGDRLFAGAARAFLDERAGWRVVGVVHDGLQALAAVNREPPQALLMLHDLPRLGPAAVARQIRHRWPGVNVVIVGDIEAEDAIVVNPNAGGRRVLDALAAPAPPARPVEEAEVRPSSVDLLGSLTPRERLILGLLGEGLVTGDIARRLGVSLHTVRTHMQNLYAKLGCHSRLDVVRFAAEHGLVSAGAKDHAG